MLAAWIFPAALAAAVATGILAQRWKGRTGALWGFIALLVCVAPFLTFADIMESGWREVEDVRSRLGLNTELGMWELGVTYILYCVLPPFVIMAVVVATLPSAGRVGTVDVPASSKVSASEGFKEQAASKPTAPRNQTAPEKATGAQAAGIALVLVLTMLGAGWLLSGDKSDVDTTATAAARHGDQRESNRNLAGTSGEAVATLLNLKGHLCAQVTHVIETSPNSDRYIVQCIEYRGGTGTVEYLLNSESGHISRLGNVPPPAAAPYTYSPGGSR